MAFLSEYAIIPDFFEALSSGDMGHVKYVLKDVKKRFLEASIIRDMRYGQWKSYCLEKGLINPFDPCRLLLEELAINNRLRNSPPVLPKEPTCNIDWVMEALALSSKEDLTGVLTTESTKAGYDGATDKLAAFENLTEESCWNSHYDEKYVKRNYESYLEELIPILRLSQSLKIYDPYLDPSRHPYCEKSYLNFIKRLAQNKNRIEIHRENRDQGNNGKIYSDDRQMWDRRFQREWGVEFYKAGIEVNVFLWGDLRERYLITDIIGLEVGHGLVEDYKAPSLWKILPKSDKDEKRGKCEIESRYDSSTHKPWHEFKVPNNSLE